MYSDFPFPKPFFMQMSGGWLHPPTGWQPLGRLPPPVGNGWISHSGALGPLRPKVCQTSHGSLSHLHPSNRSLLCISAYNTSFITWLCLPSAGTTSSLSSLFSVLCLATSVKSLLKSRIFQEALKARTLDTLYHGSHFSVKLARSSWTCVKCAHNWKTDLFFFSLRDFRT